MDTFIPAAWYHPLFLVFMSILVLIKIYPSPDSNVLSYESDGKGYIKVWLLGFILILFFGLRDPIDPHFYFADTSGYASVFEKVKEGTFTSSFSDLLNGTLDTDKEVGFLLIRDLMADWQFDVEIWFIVVAAIYIIPVILAIHKMFPGYEYLAFLFWLCSFGFYGGAVNGLRNADATSLFFLGFTLIILNINHFKGKKFQIIIGIFLCFLSYYFHHSITILWISFLASLFIVKNTNIALLIWFAAIISSLLFGNSLANLAASWELDERADSYLARGENVQLMQEAFSHVGFRWDFLLFSVVPIALGYYVTNIKGIKDKTFQTLLNTYIIANAVWIIFMYAAFTNRFASLSWALYPFVLCYPMIKFKVYPNKQTMITALLLSGLLIFSWLF